MKSVALEIMVQSLIPTPQQVAQTGPTRLEYYRSGTES